MTITATYPVLRHEWLEHETDPLMGRAEAVLASGEGQVRHGTLLGVVAASGKYAVCDLTANDGRETPRAFLFTDGAVDATSADQDIVVVTGGARIIDAKAVFHSSFDTAAKITTAFDALAAFNIFRSRAV